MDLVAVVGSKETSKVFGDSMVPPNPFKFFLTFSEGHG